MNFDFTYGTGVIEGTVYSRPGTPITDQAHLFVNISSPDGGRSYFSTQSKDGGKYRIENLVAGRVSIGVNSETYGGKTVTVDLADNAQVQRDVVLSTGTTVHLELTNPPAPNEGWAQAWLLSGTIPIRSLSSEVVDGFFTFGNISAGFSNGRARMDKIEPGTYTLVVVSRPNSVFTEEEVDPYANAAWTTQFIEIKGEREISIQVSV